MAGGERRRRRDQAAAGAVVVHDQGRIRQVCAKAAPQRGVDRARTFRERFRRDIADVEFQRPRVAVRRGELDADARRRTEGELRYRAKRLGVRGHEVARQQNLDVVRAQAFSMGEHACEIAFEHGRDWRARRRCRRGRRRRSE